MDNTNYQSFQTLIFYKVIKCKFWEAFVKKKISSMFSKLKEKDSLIHSLPSEDSQKWRFLDLTQSKSVRQDWDKNYLYI